MDDMCLVHESREYLQECLKTVTELCVKLKITVNMKKTRIVKLKDGMDFPKGKYVLLESGKILRLPGKDSAKRMRRKLKKFKTLTEAGEIWMLASASYGHQMDGGFGYDRVGGTARAWPESGQGLRLITRYACRTRKSSAATSCVSSKAAVRRMLFFTATRPMPIPVRGTAAAMRRRTLTRF
jgi:hypothetical protein